MNRMDGVDNLSKQTRRNNGKNRRPKKKLHTPHGHGSKRSSSVKSTGNFEKVQKASMHGKPQTSILRFVKRPEQWKSRQTSKQMVYKEFLSTFGSQKKSEESIHATAPSSVSSKTSLKQIRKEINQVLLNPKLNFESSLECQKREKAVYVTAAKDIGSEKVAKNISFVSFISRKPKGKKSFLATNAASPSKRAENSGSKSKKRHKQNDGSSTSFLKKPRR